MSPVELERHLERCEPSRREFLKTLILGTAYAAPIVTSFGMDGLGLDPAGASGFIGNQLCGEGNLTPDVVIAKSASPEPVVAGALLTYTIEVYNCSPDAADNVVVADQLPLGTTYVSSSQTVGAKTVPFLLTEPGVGTEGGLWQASISSLPSYETACFEVVVQVDP